jgi:hypothetical protein
MKMYCIKFADFAVKRTTQRWCPIEPSEQRARKISNLNAFQIDRKSDWHTTVSRTINIRSKDLDFMPSCYQRLAETMSCKDRSSIAHGRQVARDDVEDPHKSTFFVYESGTRKRVRPRPALKLQHPPHRRRSRRSDRRPHPLRSTRKAFLDHERSKADLKALMPEDAKEAIGHGVRAKRSKSGAISFDLLEVEGGSAALQ